VRFDQGALTGREKPPAGHADGSGRAGGQGKILLNRKDAEYAEKPKIIFYFFPLLTLRLCGFYHLLFGISTLTSTGM
jgi:hypothetical protein